MKPALINGNVRTRCPDCEGAVSTFEFRDSAREFGHIIADGQHQYQGQTFSRIIYVFMRCAGCHRGGVAKIHDKGNFAQGTLESFFPSSIESATLPGGVPSGIVAEFREAELCASVGSWRASSALFRSVLEKTLKENGYTKGNLQDKVDEAASDGVITEARRKRAHEDIRVLGNDVLHDEWRQVTEEEVGLAHQYAQRILEDLYDDRDSVEGILIVKKRIKSPTKGVAAT